MKATGFRFNITSFGNRGGSVSYRVTGTKRTGERVRENFSDKNDAHKRHVELEAEFHAGESETVMRATKLSHEQIQVAEMACNRMGQEWPRLLDAVDRWMQQGKQASPKDAPRIDEAYDQFKNWLTAQSGFRDRTQSNLRLRVNLFVNSLRNIRLSDITADTVEHFLDGRKVSRETRDNDRRALSRFFSWCIYPKKWIVNNPAKKQVRERRRGSETLPSVLTLDQCEKLLRAAELHRHGRLVPYVALCLFGGLRPFEASRLVIQQINLADLEITLEPWQTKTGTSRMVSICDTLAAWLAAYPNREVFPANWRKDFDTIKKQIGFGYGLAEWPEDVLRHTAISHYFRKTGSYGRTAEQFGNSEAIIKKHYQGRVSSEDTKRFYALRPVKGGAK